MTNYTLFYISNHQRAAVYSLFDDQSHKMTVLFKWYHLKAIKLWAKYPAEWDITFREKFSDGSKFYIDETVSLILKWNRNNWITFIMFIGGALCYLCKPSCGVTTKTCFCGSCLNKIFASQNGKDFFPSLSICCVLWLSVVWEFHLFFFMKICVTFWCREHALMETGD